MAADFSNLSHAFTGIDPDQHRINRVLMVGALRENGVISDSDFTLLRRFSNVLEHWNVPQAADFSRLHEPAARSGLPTVRTMNIRPDQGGEDFLKSAVSCDAIILCNIPRDIPKREEIDRMVKHGMLSAVSNLLSSFAASADHDNLPLWRDQIKQSGAKMVMVTNTDGFELSELNDGSFLSVSVPYMGESAGKNVGILVRKDYLEDIETYLTAANLNGAGKSPLLALCEEACAGGSGSFAYNAEHKSMRRFGF